MKHPFALICLFTFLFGANVYAQYQQPLPQNATSQRNFPVSKYEETKEAMKTLQYAGVGSPLEWSPMPLADRWRIIIALDSKMTEIIHVGESDTNAYNTPPLPEGEYFYYVEGLQADRLIGTTEVEPFSVITGKKKFDGTMPSVKASEEEPLPEPELVTPADGELYPPKPRLRVSWKPVPGARSYRFRFWDENQTQERVGEHKLPIVRWITEVKQPWIELHDVPYSSYMYLEPSHYRWDVTPISEKTSKLGRMSTRKFEVSRQYWLRKGELSYRFFLLYSHRAAYSSNSATDGASTTNRMNSFGGGMGIDWWFARQWGLLSEGYLRTLSLGAGGNPSSWGLSLDLARRAYLTDEKYGYTIAVKLGFGMKSMPQVDRLDPVKVTLPQAAGPRFGLKLSKWWSDRWQTDLHATTMLPAFVFNAEGGSDQKGIAFNLQYGINFKLMNSQHFAWNFGVQRDIDKVAYYPRGASAMAVNWFNGTTGVIAAQFSN